MPANSSRMSAGDSIQGFPRVIRVRCRWCRYPTGGTVPQAHAISSGSIVHSEMLRCAPLLSETLNAADDSVGVHGATHVHCESCSGVFIDDVQQPELAKISGFIELEVQSPHMVRMLSRNRVPYVGRPPQAPQPLVIHHKTFTADHHVGFAPAQARVLAGRADATYGAASHPHRPRPAASSGGRSRT